MKASNMNSFPHIKLKIHSRHQMDNENSFQQNTIETTIHPLMELQKPKQRIVAIP